MTVITVATPDPGGIYLGLQGRFHRAQGTDICGLLEKTGVNDFELERGIQIEVHERRAGA